MRSPFTNMVNHFNIFLSSSKVSIFSRIAAIVESDTQNTYININKETSIGALFDELGPSSSNLLLILEDHEKSLDHLETAKEKGIKVVYYPEVIHSQESFKKLYKMCDKFLFLDIPFTTATPKYPNTILSGLTKIRLNSEVCIDNNKVVMVQPEGSIDFSVVETLAMAMPLLNIYITTDTPETVFNAFKLPPNVHYVQYTNMKDALLFNSDAVCALITNHTEWGYKYALHEHVATGLPCYVQELPMKHQSLMVRSLPPEEDYSSFLKYLISREYEIDRKHYSVTHRKTQNWSSFLSKHVLGLI